MKGKEHLRNLDIVSIPTDYPRDSEKVSLSLPIFYSSKGKNTLFDEDSNFNRESFEKLVCLSSVWAAVSIATNTDLCEKGMPIYFHIEDKVIDIARPILYECGVPEDWIREVSFDEFKNRDQIRESNMGKKFAIYLDESITTEVCIMWDTDAHIYRSAKDGIFQWYEKFENNLNKVPMFSFYSDWNGHENLYVNWLLLASGQIERDFNKDDPGREADLKRYEEKSYNAVGLDLPNQQHRWGSAILSLPRIHPLFDFIIEHYSSCYTDEALLSMFMNVNKNDFTLVDDELLKFVQNEKEFIDSGKSCVLHLPGMSKEQLPKYNQKMLRGIDGRSSNKMSSNIKPFITDIKEKGRVHILSVPHNPSNKFFSTCAFAQKARKLSFMCDYTGYETYHYGNELSDVVCTEHITVTTEDDLNETYGDFITQSEFYKWGIDHYAYKQFFLRAEHELRKRFRPNDIICYVFAPGQRPIYNALQDLEGAIHCESGIGYYYPYAPYRVHESPGLMHFNLGIAQARYDKWNAMTKEQKKLKPIDMNSEIHHSWMQWYDAVIPNSFDLEDFEYSGTNDDYFLCLGRIMPGKGIEIAMRAAHALGKKLIVAGQGNFEKEMGFKEWDNVELVGRAGIELRKELLSNCIALFCLSTYPEPFGGVHIEANLSGKPVISTDIGAYCHSVKNKLTGYRVRLNVYEQAVWAAKNIDKIDPETCRKWGQRFINERVALSYDEYFSSVIASMGNNKSPFWQMNPERTNLDWIDDSLDWIKDPIL